MSNQEPPGWRDALIIDATCPPDLWVPGYADWLDGGFSACALSVGGGTVGGAVAALGAAYRMVRNDPRLTQVQSAQDIREAHRSGRLGVLLHFQSTRALDYEPDLVEVYQRLGVRMMGLAYNRRNPLCDGCEEPSDAGLSILGRRMIAEMNRTGILVDFAHTGWRTCAEALEVSTAPCVASHSNAHAVKAHRRNLPDEIIRGIAASGGVIGMNGFPAFVSPDPAPTLDQFIDHIVHIDSLVGSGHVGLGLDYCTITTAEYQEMIDSGAWSPENYPPPPWNYPAGITTPRTIGALADRMDERGYSETEIRGVLGENWMRLFERMWPR